MENRKTINDLIRELQQLKQSLRKLPVVIITPNGTLFEPIVKVLVEGNDTILDKPKQMIVTYE